MAKQGSSRNRRTKKLYVQLKQCQATWEDSRDAVLHCREEIRAAKALLELKVASTLRDDKKGFLKYINGKRQARNNIGPLLDENGHLASRGIVKSETLNAFFALVFNTDGGL